MPKRSSADLRQLLAAINSLNSGVEAGTLADRTLTAVQSLIPNEMTVIDGFDTENNHSAYHWYSPDGTITDDLVHISDLGSRPKGVITMTIRQLTFLLRLTTLVLLTAAMSPSSALAQSSGEVDLQPLKPDGEEFTVLMPKDPKPKFEESQEPYHRMTLNGHLYLSASENGPVLAVASLSGIKANGAGYTESERLNSYVDAFKNWFPQKVRGKDASAKLTLVGEKTLNGNTGREYRLVVGELSGTARVFVTRRRFYAAVMLTPKKDDVLMDQFLSSFVLPEKPVPPPPVVAVSPNSATQDAGKPAKNGDEAQKTEAVTDAAVDPKSGEAVAAKPGERAPVSGGVLNSKALVLPLPEYPPIAARAKAAGIVTVQILVDETGSVVNAHAISGHPLLQEAAVAAARQARFSPTSLMGEPVKVTGVLTYNFAAP